jgi:hypothetical protein
MLPLQCCELLFEGQGLEEEPATSAEESKNRTQHESNEVYHASVLPYFDGERQRCILLKSQADVILANDSMTCDSDILFCVKLRLILS